MHRITLAAAVLSALMASGGAVRADTIWDVENARGNARAGGPSALMTRSCSSAGVA